MALIIMERIGENRNSKQITVLLLCFLTILAMLSSCGTPLPSTNIERAESFIERVLTLPSKEFAELEEKYVPTGDAELISEKFSEAAKALCDGYAAKSLYEETSAFIGSVLTVHSVAAGGGYSQKVLSVELEEANEKNFSYTALIEDSREAEPYEMTGNIQFNEDNLIDYMTVQR